MAKVKDNNIILDAGEQVVFPNSAITEDSTAGLVITGVSSIDAASIGGIPVNDSAKADGKVLQYNLATNTLVYVTPAE